MIGGAETANYTQSFIAVSYRLSMLSYSFFYVFSSFYYLFSYALVGLALWPLCFGLVPTSVPTYMAPLLCRGPLEQTSTGTVLRRSAGTLVLPAGKWLYGVGACEGSRTTQIRTPRVFFDFDFVVRGGASRA